MSHTNLETYYRRTFALVQYHKWDPNWLENLIPWELDAYVEQLKQHLEEERARREKEQKMR